MGETCPFRGGKAVVVVAVNGVSGPASIDTGGDKGRLFSTFAGAPLMFAPSSSLLVTPTLKGDSIRSAILPGVVAGSSSGFVGV